MLADCMGHLLRHMREYNAESPKQSRKRFNSNAKTIDFDHLVIIYLCPPLLPTHYIASTLSHVIFAMTGSPPHPLLAVNPSLCVC